MLYPYRILVSAEYPAQPYLLPTKCARFPSFRAFSTSGHNFLRASLSAAVKSSLKRRCLIDRRLFAFESFHTKSLSDLERNLIITGLGVLLSLASFSLPILCTTSTPSITEVLCASGKTSQQMSFTVALMFSSDFSFLMYRRKFQCLLYLSAS